MIIRKIMDDDRQDLVKLVSLFYLDHKQKTFPLARQQFEAYKNPQSSVNATVDFFLADQSRITLVAEKEGKLIGYISAEIKNKPDRILDKEGYIHDWFVMDEYRSGQIGKELFNQMIDTFKRKDCTHVALSTFVENTQARAIYERLGFDERVIQLTKKIR